MKQGSVLGRGKMTEFPTTEEIGDWSEQAEKLPAGGRGKPPPRLGGRGKKEGGRPGSGSACRGAGLSSCQWKWGRLHSFQLV